MKLVDQHRTYEEHDGDWFVAHPSPARAGILRQAAELAVMALVLAAIGVIAIAVAVAALLLLPIGLLNRSPRQPRNSKEHQP